MAERVSEITKMPGMSPAIIKIIFKFTAGRAFPATDVVEAWKLLKSQGVPVFTARIAKNKHKKRPIFMGLAADEGFEPSRTESESGVLPLH